MKSIFSVITHRCKAILRLWAIQEARKRRVEREYQEAWDEGNQMFIKNMSKESDREIDRHFDLDFRKKLLASKDYYDFTDNP